MRGVLIPVTGPAAWVDVDDLASMQCVVCGYIEIVRVPGWPRDPDRGYPVLVVNDEGLLNGSPVNERASNLYPNLHGDVLLLGEGLIADEQGVEDLDLVSITTVHAYRLALDAIGPVS